MHLFLHMLRNFGDEANMRILVPDVPVSKFYFGGYAYYPHL